MELNGRSIVVTGAASGIGRALAERFAAEGPRALILADIDEERVQAGAGALGKPLPSKAFRARRKQRRLETKPQ